MNDANKKLNRELKKAITIYGSQARLAEAITAKLDNGKQVTQQSISYWLRSSKGVPKGMALKITELCPQLSLLSLLLVEDVANGRQPKK